MAGSMASRTLDPALQMNKPKRQVRMPSMFYPRDAREGGAVKEPRMIAGTAGGTAEVAVAALDDERAPLPSRIGNHRPDSSDQSEDLVGSALFNKDLESVHEELRIANGEVRAQQEELERLVQTQRTIRWQHDRLLAALPVAVFVTDAHGVITSVNAAAAAMLHVRVDRMIKKPLQTFVEESDWIELRRQLSQAVTQGDDFRRTVTLLPCDRAPLQAELTASVAFAGPLAPTEVTWLMLYVDDSAEMPHKSHVSLAAAFTELTQIPLATTETHQVLAKVADVCGRVLGPDFSVSVNVGEPSAPRSVATSSKLAQNIDGAQTAADEGPCQSAWESAGPLLSKDLKADDRWPVFTELIASLAVRGALAVPVRLGDELVGSLNAYTETEAVTEDLLELLELLGTAVAAILNEIDQKAELESLARNLQEALKSRAAIDQAKGIIMAKHGCDSDEAFERLAKLSSQTNIKLRQVARLVVETAASGRELPGDIAAS